MTDVLFDPDNQPEETLFGLEEPKLDRPIDQEKINETLNLSLPPKGMYRTNPEENGNMNVSIKDFPDDAGERRVMTISGKVTGRFPKRQSPKNPEGIVSVFISFQLSPDTRFAKDWDTKELLDRHDAASNRWAEAHKAYKATFKEEPKGEEQIVEYLVFHPIGLKCAPIGGKLRVTEVLPYKGR